MVLAIAVLFLHLGPMSMPNAVGLAAEPVAAVSAATATVEIPAVPDVTADATRVSATASGATTTTSPATSATAPATSATTAATGEARIKAEENPGAEPAGASPTPGSAGSFSSALRDSEALSAIRIADENSGKAGRFVSPEALPSRRNWIALAFAVHAAAGFDAYTTRLSISRGALEADPLMKPFANSSAIYAAIQVSPVVLDFAARRMQRSENNFLRRTWWMPQAAATGMFLFSGAHNLRVAGGLR